MTQPTYTSMRHRKAKMAHLISEIEPAELACRILEGAMGLKRPVGVTAIQALSELDEESRDGMYRAARNAAEYITQCINNGKIPS